MVKTRHESFAGASTLHPAVSNLGQAEFARAKPGWIHPHDHDERWEMCMIHSGQVHWWVEDEVYLLGPGQIFITRPHERHGEKDSFLAVTRVTWIIFSLEAISRDPYWAQFSEVFAASGLRCVEANSDMESHFDDILKAHRQPLPHGALLTSVLMQRLLLAIHEQHKNGDNNHFSPGIGSIVEHLDTHPDETLDMQSLAHRAGLSLSVFHRRFRQETGFSPNNYRVRARIRSAQDLLIEGQSVTEVAMALGFPSSQYFASVFRKYTGLSPSAWQVRRLTGESSKEPVP